jgi:hypothetical protein
VTHVFWEIHRKLLPKGFLVVGVRDVFEDPVLSDEILVNVTQPEIDQYTLFLIKIVEEVIRLDVLVNYSNGV